MTNSNQIDSIIDILSNIIIEKIKPGLDRKQITPNIPLLEEGLGLDSIMVVDLIVAVEKHFAFNFAEDDLSLESFASLMSLAKVIDRHELDIPVA